MAKIKKKKKSTKWIVLAVAAVLVAGGIIMVVKVSAASGSADTTTKFIASTVKTGDINITISGSGTVTDTSDYSLTSANAGTITSLPVKQGDAVKAGQVIAKINDTTSAQTVLQKKQSLASAQLQLQQAQASLADLYIKTPIAGRVKSIIASVGDDVSQLKSLGSLAVVSTKRAMTVTVSASGSSGSFGSLGSSGSSGSSGSQSLSVGETVTVSDTTNGKTYSGTVTAAGNQGDTVTIGTDVPGIGDSATVQKSGKTIGSGTLALVSSVAINSSSGTITNVYVTENELVSKSQSLFKLDATTAENNISSAEVAVTAAQNDLKTAEEAQAKDTITSPVDGTIAELDVRNGDSVSTGTAIATIIDPGAMQTVISVDELDISKVKVGQKASITLDAISGKTFTGEVTLIDPIGTSSNGVTEYNVTVNIDKPTGVMVGMSTSAVITTQSKTDVIVVSASEVLEKSGTTGYVLDASKLFDSNGKSITVSNMTTRQLVQQYGIAVKIGLATSSEYEITSGINVGDTIARAVTTSKTALASLKSTSSGYSRSVLNGITGGTTGGMGGGPGGYGG
ncbi:MAG: HlyD family efflux transporter periplasmic adaptor subunit [Clostridia bacterium]|nr:HlyD family efflux transporter periplasmic adaptor subunit [Clostridia bacterium]